MPIGPACFAEWRGNKDKFVRDFEAFCAQTSRDAGLVPKFAHNALELAFYSAERHIRVLESYFLPEREDGNMSEASELKQLGAYLHFTASSKPIASFVNIPESQEDRLLKLFGAEREIDSDLRELLLDFQSEALCVLFFYEVVANFFRANAGEYRERIDPIYIKNLCAYLQQGRHDPDGLCLILTALTLD